MAISRVGTAGTFTAGTTSVSSLPAPANIQNGDVLLAFIVDHATSGSSAAPTGWTFLGGTVSSNGRLQVFRAIVGAGGLTGTSWTFSGLATRSGGQIYAYRGVSNAQVQDVSYSARSNASGTTGTTSITPVTNGNMVIAAFAALASGSTWSAEACATGPTITEIADTANSTYLSLAVADGLQAVAGATGDTSATMLTAGVNAALLLSLRPVTFIPAWAENCNQFIGGDN